MFYVGKSFIDRAKKTFSMGFIVRKPLLQILRGDKKGITKLYGAASA